MYKNKGYTLVEMIVAITVGAILAVGLTTLFIMSLQSNKTTRAAATVQIESQTISQNLKPILMSASEYDTMSNGDILVLEIKTRYRYDFRNIDEEGNISFSPIDGYYYFIVDQSTKKAFIKFESEKIEDVSTIDTSSMDNYYLGQYITSFNITPNTMKVDSVKNTEEPDYTINITFYFNFNGYTQNITNSITLRNH